MALYSLKWLIRLEIWLLTQINLKKPTLVWHNIINKAKFLIGTWDFVSSHIKYDRKIFFKLSKGLCLFTQTGFICKLYLLNEVTASHPSYPTEKSYSFLTVSKVCGLMGYDWPDRLKPDWCRLRTGWLGCLAGEVFAEETGVIVLGVTDTSQTGPS